jgi:hypothetical protein
MFCFQMVIHHYILQHNGIASIKLLTPSRFTLYRTTLIHHQSRPQQRKISTYEKDNQRIVVRLRADVRNIPFFFSGPSIRALGPKNTLFNGYQGLFLRRVRDHSPLNSNEVTNAWHHISVPPHAFIWRTISQLLTLWYRIFTSKGESYTKEQIPCFYGIQRINVLPTKSRE